MSTPVSHYIDFPQDCHFSVYEELLTDFASKGGRNVVGTTSFLRLALQSDGMEFVVKSRKLLEKLGLRFLGAHSFWGAEWDLNQLDSTCQGKVLENQRKVMEIASEIQADILVLHPGDFQFVHGSPSVSAMREQCIRTLETLLPYAKKLGIRLSLENIIAPSDTAQENLAILEYFHSPSLVCCYDTGHANVMENAPGKDPQNVCEYIRTTLWHDKLELVPQGSTLERLRPYIATAHVHDNNGYEDEHILPGRGKIQWEKLIPDLLSCPYLDFVQNEVNWQRYGHSTGETIECFHKLFP